VLAAFVTDTSTDLEEYLRTSVFGGAAFETANPDPADAAGFTRFLDRYSAGLAVQRAAVDTLTLKGSPR
ncbi:hypothetical protein, partial [Escherichia coli]